ncbi:MAG TPA: hypothetical protein VIX63_06005 [Vicinamibacterales bacterium]
MRVPALALLLAALTSACGGGLLKKEYEYEEELYLSLDGSAQLNVNASVASLVALRGADLAVDPRARVDRADVRALFDAPGVEVSTPTFSRRDGRRFVHVRLDVADLRRLSSVTPLSWSTYRFERQGDTFEYRQVVGPSAGKAVESIGWTGDELVAFRMHLPSKVDYHNAPSRRTERGNILEWEQPLAARLKGETLELEVRMEPETILYTTLLLFGATIVAAVMTFAAVIFWVARRGRDPEMAELRP